MCASGKSAGLKRREADKAAAAARASAHRKLKVRAATWNLLSAHPDSHLKIVAGLIEVGTSSSDCMAAQFASSAQIIREFLCGCR